jgi:hypothetical protein
MTGSGTCALKDRVLEPVQQVPTKTAACLPPQLQNRQHFQNQHLFSTAIISFQPLVAGERANLDCCRTFESRELSTEKADSISFKRVERRTGPSLRHTS